MVIRGAYMLDSDREQRSFVMQRSREQLREIERTERIPHTHIMRMLDNARDTTNYLHNVYRHRLGNQIFEFRRHRTVILLHSVTRLY